MIYSSCSKQDFFQLLNTNCISYARPQISYHMHTKTAYYMHAKHIRIIFTPKSNLAYQYHEFSFLFLVLFIHIFVRPAQQTVDCSRWSP